MAEETVRLGFISPSPSGGRHYDRFLALMPPGLTVQFETLGLWRETVAELEGAVDLHAQKTAELIDRHGWHAAALMGAPIEVQNPGFPDRIRAAINVPACSALEAGSDALNALSAQRVLLLTPFDAAMNELVGRYLVDRGMTSAFAATDFSSLAVAQQLSSDEVYDLAKKGLAASGSVDAIFFQGARLDPLAVIERLEDELGIPVVASNPAMLWRTASELGLRYEIPGVGRLLREWPAVPSRQEAGQAAHDGGRGL